MTATLSNPAVTAAETAARHRMQLAEGGPFLVSDRSRAVALHWLVDPAELSVMAGPLPRGMAAELRDGAALVSLVVYRALTTRVSVGDRFAPWIPPSAAEQPWVAELRLACEIRGGGGPAEPGFLTIAIFTGDAALATWVRADKLGLRCLDAGVEAVFDGKNASFLLACRGGSAGRLALSATEPDSPAHTLTDVPDAVGATCDPVGIESDAMDWARRVLDRLAMFTCERGITRRIGLWRKPLPTSLALIEHVDLSNLPRELRGLAQSRLIGAHTCDAIDGMWIGKPQCVAGPACAIAWREL